jgi:hypothetical protein
MPLISLFNVMSMELMHNIKIAKLKVVNSAQNNL